MWYTYKIPFSTLKVQEMQETWLPSLGQEDLLGEEMATHLSISCLENSMDRGAWWATVHGVTESDMIEVTKHAACVE